MSQVEFDEEMAARIEALYRIGDAVRRRRIVREALGAASGERILDVGCGPGFYCAELAEDVGPSGSVIGVDSSPAMLELAARRCAGQSGVELRPGEAVSLPVDDASFDAALCVQVLEYVADPTVALAEMHRALRPGGRVVVWDVDWATVSLHALDPAAHRSACCALGRAPHPSVAAAHTRAPVALGRLRGGAHGRRIRSPPASSTLRPTASPCSRSLPRSWSDATGSPTSRPRRGSPSSSSSANAASSTSRAPNSASQPPSLGS